jgi:hypothetical protein
VKLIRLNNLLLEIMMTKGRKKRGREAMWRRE